MRRLGKYIVIFGLLILSLAWGSCRPRGVLSESKMEEALYKLHRTDQVVLFAGLTRDDNPEVDNYYLHTLDAMGITQAQFDSSVVWYTDHPQTYEKLYPHVVAKLEREAHMWQNLYEAEQMAYSSTEKEEK